MICVLKKKKRNEKSQLNDIKMVGSKQTLPLLLNVIFKEILT